MKHGEKSKQKEILIKLIAREELLFVALFSSKFFSRFPVTSNFLTHA